MLQFIKLAMHYADATNPQTEAKAYCKAGLFINKDELSVEFSHIYLCQDRLEVFVLSRFPSLSSSSSAFPTCVIGSTCVIVSPPPAGVYKQCFPSFLCQTGLLFYVCSPAIVPHLFQRRFLGDFPFWPPSLFVISYFGLIICLPVSLIWT